MADLRIVTAKRGAKLRIRINGHPHTAYEGESVHAALLAAGCAQQASRPAQGEDSPLQRWLDAELAPYLAEQLGRHPRFKGEPVMLVSLDGPDIQPDIDGLTRSLRDQLMDRLLAEPGVRLPWQPQQRQEQHHRRLERANCASIRDADYYIGIEITRSAADRYRVAVRALDVRAGEWVSGFGSSWSSATSSPTTTDTAGVQGVSPVSRYFLALPKSQ